MTYKKGLIILALWFVASLINDGWGKVHTANIKFTVIVDTPQGQREGSSILKLKVVEYPSRLINRKRTTKTGLYGEAVFVDLPNGKTLFIPLHTRPPLPIMSYKKALNNKQFTLSQGEIVEKIKLHPTPFSISEADHPMMFYFEKNESPQTLQQAMPNLSASFGFGSGYAIHSMQISATSEAVNTNKIIRKIPWVEYENRTLSPNFTGQTTNKNIMRNVNRTNFRLFYQCEIKPEFINGLSYGMMKSGIGCSY
jgi:hypothetical protein